MHYPFALSLEVSVKGGNRIRFDMELLVIKKKTEFDFLYHWFHIAHVIWAISYWLYDTSYIASLKSYSLKSILSLTWTSVMKNGQKMYAWGFSLIRHISGKNRSFSKKSTVCGSPMYPILKPIDFFTTFNTLIPHWTISFVKIGVLNFSKMSESSAISNKATLQGFLFMSWLTN